MAEKGKVKWFSNVKGFGFLQKDGEEKDIFVHYSAILGEGYKTLVSGEDVTFEIVESDKGAQAKNVIRAKKPPKEAPKAAEPEKKSASSEEKAAEKKESSESPAEKPESEKE